MENTNQDSQYEQSNMLAFLKVLNISVRYITGQFHGGHLDKSEFQRTSIESVTGQDSSLLSVQKLSSMEWSLTAIMMTTGLTMYIIKVDFNNYPFHHNNY